jgi:hypothetical protein
MTMITIHLGANASGRRASAEFTIDDFNNMTAKIPVRHDGESVEYVSVNFEPEDVEKLLAIIAATRDTIPDYN